MDKNEIIIYQTEDNNVDISVKLENDTIWLTQDAICALFESSKANISKHISNIYKEGELEKDSTVRKIRTVQKEGNRNVTRERIHYNLDLILSVGYRVKSKTATKFRIWATNILKEYILKNNTMGKNQIAEEKLKMLQNTITLCSRSIEYQAENLQSAILLAQLLDNFAHGLDLLDNFDHKTLDSKGQTKREAVRVTEEEFLQVIDKMKSEFASDVFANPKDRSFASSVNQIYQTFGGNDCYQTLEEKAAMLLYLITKNHSFSDGNKRIAASCFLYFLNKNNMLYKNNLPIIDNGTLFALTLLIAESKPSEMEIMKQIVVSFLNKG